MTWGDCEGRLEGQDVPTNTWRHAAYVAAMERLASASTEQDYRAALQHIIDVARDPGTRERTLVDLALDIVSGTDRALEIVSGADRAP